jgi:hypothetical protein
MSFAPPGSLEQAPPHFRFCRSSSKSWPWTTLERTSSCQALSVKSLHLSTQTEMGAPASPFASESA